MVLMTRASRLRPTPRLRRSTSSRTSAIGVTRSSTSVVDRFANGDVNNDYGAKPGCLSRYQAIGAG